MSTLIGNIFFVEQCSKKETDSKVNRFLTQEHRSKVFDRAGNALPTGLANDRVAGAWEKCKGGNVVYILFEPVEEE